METPIEQVLLVQPQMQDYEMNTFDRVLDKSIGKLSAIPLNVVNTKSCGDPNSNARNSIADVMNEELLMEYQLEQLLAQQIDLSGSCTQPKSKQPRHTSPAFSNSNKSVENGLPPDAQPCYGRNRINQKDFVSFKKPSEKKEQTHQTVNETL